MSIGWPVMIEASSKIRAVDVRFMIRSGKSVGMMPLAGQYTCGVGWIDNGLSGLVMRSTSWIMLIDWIIELADWEMDDGGLSDMRFPLLGKCRSVGTLWMRMKGWTVRFKVWRAFFWSSLSICGLSIRSGTPLSLSDSSKTTVEGGSSQDDATKFPLVSTAGVSDIRCNLSVRRATARGCLKSCWKAR